MRRTQAIEREEWGVEWHNRTPVEIGTIRTLLAAVGFSGVFAWTPPGESSARAFQFLSFSDASRSASAEDARATLLHVPGAAVPSP